jgi:hypothetical protein
MADMVQVPVPHRAGLASPRLLRLFRPARRFRRQTNYATNNNIRGALVDPMRNHWPTAHDEARAMVFDAPRRREVARVAFAIHHAVCWTVCIVLNSSLLTENQ